MMTYHKRYEWVNVLAIIPEVVGIILVDWVKVELTPPLVASLDYKSGM